MNTDYTQPLKSFLSYQAGKINNYDKELFAYCRTLGFDLGTTLAIYFAHNRQQITEILHEKIPFNYSAPMRILTLKKLSAEEKFRDAYGIVSDYDLLILKEKEHIWNI